MKTIRLVFLVIVLLLGAAFSAIVSEPNNIQVAGQVTSQWVNPAGDTILLVSVPENGTGEFSPAVIVRVVLENEPEYSWLSLGVGDFITVTGAARAAISDTHDFMIIADKLRRGNMVPQ